MAPRFDSPRLDSELIVNYANAMFTRTMRPVPSKTSECENAVQAGITDTNPGVEVADPKDDGEIDAMSLSRWEDDGGR